MKWPIEGDNLEWSALTGALSVEESMIVVVKNPQKWKKTNMMCPLNEEDVYML